MKTQTKSEVLDAFLLEVRAIGIKHFHLKESNVEIEVMLANGKALIVQTFWDINNKKLTGWDIFIPASYENNVQKTLDAVRDYLKQ